MKNTDGKITLDNIATVARVSIATAHRWRTGLSVRPRTRAKCERAFVKLGGIVIRDSIDVSPAG